MLLCLPQILPLPARNSYMRAGILAAPLSYEVTSRNRKMNGNRDIDGTFEWCPQSRSPLDWSGLLTPMASFRWC